MSLARACLVVVGLSAGACSSTHELAQDAARETDVGTDAGRDAFAPDAFAPDAFAPDAFAPDAFTPDAFDPPDGSDWDPEWQSFVDAPADCDLAIARHPERLSWPVGRVDAVWTIRGTVYFDVTVVGPSPAQVWYRGLADASGRVVTAFRQGPYCNIDDLAVAADDVGVHVTHCGWGSPCGFFGLWTPHVYRGRYDVLATTQRHVAQYDLVLMDDIPPSPRIALGATLTAITDLHSVVHVTRPDGTLAPLASSREADPFFIGDELFFVSARHVVRSVDGGPLADLHDELGNTIGWLGTDGHTIAWAVGDTDLYWGSYDGVLHGTLVRTDTHALRGIVGDVYVARTTYGTGSPLHLALEVDRLTDGRRARVELPEYDGVGPALILHVSADAIFLRAPRGEAEPLAEIRRIDPRTLTFR